MSQEHPVNPAGSEPPAVQFPAVFSVEEFFDSTAQWRTLAAPNLCAVLGRPIAHSLSPLLHNSAYLDDQLPFTFVRIDAGEAWEIRTLLENSGADVRGFSVTMPGKSAALELADAATERATAIGTANTLVPQGDGTWLADNTDVDGVSACLEDLHIEHGINFAGTRGIVVGNGGTARPAVAALAAQGVTHVTVLARSERALNLQSLVEAFGMEFSWARFDESQVDELCADASVVISTIPAAGAKPLVPSLLRAESVVDVIYDPYPTPLLSAAAEAALPHADGLRMLAGQAERQYELFTGQAPQQGHMLNTVMSHRA